jgi:CrcB protein
MREREMAISVIAICVGASVGALLRWLLTLMLAGSLLPFPLGTLVANLAGGYLIGVAMAVFALNDAIAPEWRLLIVTGFLGGLTTFSAFSAEVSTLLQQGRLALAGAAISSHVIGSLVMTFLGLASVTVARRLF